MKKFNLGILGLTLLASACQKSDKMLPENTAEETAAVSGRKCASQEVLEEQLRNDPQRRRNLEELERQTIALAGTDAALRSGGKLFVPVVVNVVLPNANLITDAQIQTQIDVLNRDFNATNTELSTASYFAGYDKTTVANMNIEFYIQSGDIIRKNVASPATWGTNDAVKKSSQGGQDPKDAGTKLNLWVCDLSSGLLGYAQFPGGAAATDGVVIDYQGFGTTSTGYSLYSAFNKGRTATHEIGHWFNLRHIWGDARCGNDLVDDTPQHDADNAGCPAEGLRSRCAGKPLEQWMNYMDYTNDACMYMFTRGQEQRMTSAIAGARGNYTSSTRL